jgi:hypothetical protein
MNSKTLLVSALSVVLSAAAANAATSIGLHFYGYNGASYPDVLASTSIAGVAAVAQSSWNNLQISNGDGNGHWNGLQVSGTLTDSTGAAVSGLSLIAGGNSYEQFNDPSLPTALDTAESKPYSNDGAAGNWGGSGTWQVMENGAIYPSGYFDLSGIPYSSYNVFVYVAPNGGNGGYNNTVAITAISGGSVDPVTTDGVFTYGWSPNTWAQGINMVEFTGNTASRILVNMPYTGNWNGGVAAIEIVATPEPASLALLALGGLLVLPRRKSVR